MKSLFSLPGVLALGALLAACDSGGSVGGPGVPTTLTASSPATQTAVSGTAAITPAVRVVDQRGQPRGGVSVTFAVTAGGGTLGSTSATTDEAGHATAGSWTLGPVAGANVVTATAGRLGPVEFTATGEARRAATLAPVSETSQTIPIGAPVPALPSVRVTDQVGDPIGGVSVTFAVTGGGGSATGVVVTTSAQGTATVGGWRVGSTGGINTLTASVAGVAPVQFTATAEGRAPAAMTAALIPMGTIVGYPLFDAPRVRVLDHTDQPLGGVTVTFAVTGGGGSIAPSTAVTDAAGIAEAGTWTLGPNPGPNTLSATVAGVTPVTFTVDGQTRQPSGFGSASTLTQSGIAGQAVAQLPAVRVTDQRSQPLSGVPVTFAVASGGGTITGASAVTNADGIARVGSWTLGPAAGTNTLTASIAEFSPLTFTVNAVADPCAGAGYTFGTTVQGTLAAGDCRYSTGEYVDYYRVSLPAAQRTSYRLTSTQLGQFSPWLGLYTGAGDLLAYNGTGGSQAEVRLFSRSGEYRVGASSYAPNVTGSYQLSSTTFGGNDFCLDYWTTAGLTIPGELANTDCIFDSYLTDRYRIFLRSGERLTLRLESSAFDAYLRLFNPSGTQVAFNDDGGGGNDALLSYTASTTGAFTIRATSFHQGSGGPYTLSVSLAPAVSLQAVEEATPARTRRLPRGDGAPLPPPPAAKSPR